MGEALFRACPGGEGAKPPLGDERDEASFRAGFLGPESPMGEGPCSGLAPAGRGRTEHSSHPDERDHQGASGVTGAAMRLGT